jgi:ABC-2 type transport system permease protein
VRPYASAFASGARRVLGAPGELVVRLAFYVVILVVFIALWRAATAANDGSIAGYDFPAMMWYVVAAEGAVIATKPRMIEDIGNDIGTGAVTVDMLRPVSVAGFRLAVEFGEAIVRLLCALAIGGSFVAWQVGPPPTSGGVALALPAAVLGVAINLAAQHAFAGAAFWLEDAKGSWFLYQKLIFLLGGMLLPLELLPDWLASVARFLPFWTMSYVPARFMAGHIEPALVGVQAAWLGATVVAALGVFRVGERRLQVVGG